MSDSLFALKVFVRVARTGSFSRAGRELGAPQSSVSRVIAALERKLGVALFTRTTRAVMLTEAGASYLAHVGPILLALDEAENAVRGRGGELRGVLRVAVPVGIAIREVIPRLPQFMKQHPKLRIDLQMNDMRQDLLREDVDVALRFGELGDTRATARLVGIVQRVLIASPAYLKRAGTPKAPEDLPSHTVIVGPPGAGPGGWTFERDGKTLTVRPEPHLSVNVNEAATAAAVAGLGILSTGEWGARAELHAGTVVRVLKDWTMSPVKVHALFSAGRAAKASARGFVDYLATEFHRAGLDRPL